MENIKGGIKHTKNFEKIVALDLSKAYIEEFFEIERKVKLSYFHIRNWFITSSYEIRSRILSEAG